MKILEINKSEIINKTDAEKLDETKNSSVVENQESLRTYNPEEWVRSADGISATIFPRRAERFRQPKIFSIDKAKKELGYKPRVRLTEGLKKTAQWYR